MSVVLKVQDRGQIALPKRMREEMGLRSGDSVLVTPTGSGRYLLERLAPLSLNEMIEKWGTKEPTNADEVESAI